jgi:hypothetical protein
MGANGAQFNPDETAAEVILQGAPFRPKARRINNFLADSYIKDPRDAHNDVRNPGVGALIAATIA